MYTVEKKAKKDEKCKWMLEKLQSKTYDEVKAILHWEMDKLVNRGANGIGITRMSDFYPELPRSNEDKKKSMEEMIVFASFMNKEDCESDKMVQWDWEE